MDAIFINFLELQCLGSFLEFIWNRNWLDFRDIITVKYIHRVDSHDRRYWIQNVTTLNIQICVYICLYVYMFMYNVYIRMYVCMYVQ